jgi:hypothetical protein
LDNARELCGEEVGLRFTTVDQLAARMAEAKALSAEQIDRMTTLGSNAVRTLYPEKKSTDLTFRFFDDILAATR